MCRHFLGTVTTTISSLSYCGQLTTFKTILKTKNASSISIWMTAGVSFRALSWFLYAVTVRDYFYMCSSSIGLISAITQIIL
ncbi:SemiSWEET family transporter, partial [Pseudomonas oryzihabitans]|uniref:SemiSWEET family transporter n=1 Tax=Pseudomonas oryzihabitans TaxID=47885 RepID=UPI003C6E2DF9